MRIHEVDSVEALRQTSQDRLAHASPYNVYVDKGTKYNPNRNPRSQPKDAHLAIDDSDEDNPKVPQAIWNERDNRFAYLGSKKYELTQHFEVIQNLIDAVEGTTGEIDAAMIRDYGERIDGIAILEGHTIDVGEIVGDGYVPPENALMESSGEQFYGDEGEWGGAPGDNTGSVRDILGVGVRFRNSFNGQEPIFGETVGYRYISQNWMVWGESVIGTKRQTHMQELGPAFFGDLIDDVIEQLGDVEDVIANASGAMIDADQVPPLLKEAGFGKNYVKRISGQVIDYVGADDQINIWTLYNAVTYVLDHYTAEERQVNPGVYDNHEERAAGILTGEVEAPDEREDIISIIE